MKRLIILLAITISLMSFVSSEIQNPIIINQQPNPIYNLGDVINIPITLVSLTDVSGTVSMDLICGGKIIKAFYNNGVQLSAGISKKITDASLILTKSNINDLKGNCNIIINLNGGQAKTQTFKISNFLSLVKTSQQSEFNPGENLIIQGNVLKENGEGANGFINISLLADNSTINLMDVMNGGTFSVNISLPGNLKAGAYLVKLYAYEEDINGDVTNNGFSDFNIVIKQVPTNLEIVFDALEVEPGTNLKVKAILHDQSGESMPSTSYITIKNKDDKVMEQTEKNTDEFLEFPIPYNEPPSTWKVVAASNKIMSESSFRIKEKEKVNVEITNKTVSITNVGNVPYNNTVMVKVGTKSVPIEVSLGIDENKKYVMTAPDGGYNIEITTREGDKFTGMSVLTGKQINITEASGLVIDFLGNPTVWIFITLILGLFVFMLFQKIRKKSFFGFMKGRPRERKERHVELSSEGVVNSSSRNKAELSISIKGEKQTVSMACLKIKGLGNISREGDVRDTLGKIKSAAESHKAVLYENQDCLFFIITPLRTKTFDNEYSALNMAEEMKGILLNHNKLYKHKLDFGISLNYGDIIAKQEEVLKIMSLGTLMTSARKIANLARGEVLLSERMNEKVMRFAKTQREMLGDIKVYSVKGVKDTDKYKKFLEGFSKRYEEEKRSNRTYEDENM